MNFRQRQDDVTRGQQERGSREQGIVAGDHLIEGRMLSPCLYVEMRKLEVRAEAQHS